MPDRSTFALPNEIYLATILSIDRVLIDGIAVNRLLPLSRRQDRADDRSAQFVLL